MVELELRDVIGSAGSSAKFELSVSSEECGKWFQGEREIKEGERFKIGFDSTTQWLKVLRITDTDFFPIYTLKVNGQKYSAHLVPTLNTLKEKDENAEYKGDELGEDILAIPLDDPTANAAAKKIQNVFRNAKAKGGFRERILANRKMNIMQKMKMAAKAFSQGASTFRRYSLEIVRPQPTVKELPKAIQKKKPDTKWFRDPVTHYWVQLQKPTLAVPSSSTANQNSDFSEIKK